MGPPSRSFAADAYDCIMVRIRSGSTEYRRVARGSAADGEFPSDPAPLAVHPPSACSAVKALRNTSSAKAACRQAPLAFRSLDPFRALREPDRRQRDEERSSPLRTKNCYRSQKVENRLTRKAPNKPHDDFWGGTPCFAVPGAWAASRRFRPFTDRDLPARFDPHRPLPELVGALRAEKERPFTLNADAIR